MGLKFTWNERDFIAEANLLGNAFFNAMYDHAPTNPIMDRMAHVLNAGGVDIGSTRDTACEITIGDPTITEEFGDNGGIFDRDVYEFDVVAGQVITITVSADSLVDVNLYLFPILGGDRSRYGVDVNGEVVSLTYAFSQSATFFLYADGRHSSGTLVTNYTLETNVNDMYSNVQRSFGGSGNLTGSAIDDMIIGDLNTSEIINGQGGDDFLRGSLDRTGRSEFTTTQADYFLFSDTDGHDIVDGFNANFDFVILDGTSISSQNHAVSRLSQVGDDVVLTIDVNNTISFWDTNISDFSASNFFIGVTGTANDDVINGTAQNDYIDAQAGNDTVNGLEGADIILGSHGQDMISGDDGDDILYGNGGVDTILGGMGNDSLYGGGGNDDLDGDFGDDQLNGDGGNDLLNGKRGHDIINGADGDDRLIGDDGNDLLNGGTGQDSLFGSNGHDTLYGGDDIDNLFGSHGDDSLDGDDGDDNLFGGSSDDTLTGGNGEDILRGGFDNDELFGGGGADILYGGHDDDLVVGNGGADFVYGGTGDDKVNGNGGADFVYGGPGSDIVTGGDQTDILFGGDGNDILLGEEGSDELTGGRGNDQLNGGFDDDILRGGEGNDVLTGDRTGFGQPTTGPNAGEDELYGGDGDDILSGHYGDDLMSGGFGEDIFVFRDLFGVDTVIDFTDGQDRFDFTDNATFNSFADITAKLSQVGDDVILNNGPNNRLVIENSDIADFDAADFIF